MEEKKCFAICTMSFPPTNEDALLHSMELPSIAGSRAAIALPHMVDVRPDSPLGSRWS